MPIVQTGLDRFLSDPPRAAVTRRLGLLCNPASVNARLSHAATLIDRAFPGQLHALFAPQHGYFAEKQDNMVESGHDMEPVTQRPVYSLYCDTRIPTPEMMENIDTLVVDLQDVGTRVYTFIYTLSYCMEVARDLGKPVVVLDRPNPVGGHRVEGNCLDPAMASFVGRYPLPMRHGMTIGELALMFNNTFGIGCELTVVTMNGWKRRMGFRHTGLPWVPPSPNMPTPETAMVYPGQVIWEGTNISEGRGTTLPFEYVGAPFIRHRAVFDCLRSSPPPGALFRPVCFEPTSGKWQRQTCFGFHLHVIDPDTYNAYETSLQLLQAVIRTCPDRFEWKPPPYEYEYDRMPIDLIIGNADIRQRIEALEDLRHVRRRWQAGLDEFMNQRQPHLLYDDG